MPLPDGDGAGQKFISRPPDFIIAICLSVAKLAYCSINRQAGRWDSILTTGGPARSERNSTWRHVGRMWECFLERFDAVSMPSITARLPASRPQMPKINAEGLSGWFAAGEFRHFEPTRAAQLLAHVL
jgi:hypothetical protein